MNTKMKSCLECGKHTKNPKFCSSTCSTSFNNKTRKVCIDKDATKLVKCVVDGCDNQIEINLRASSINRICNRCEVVDKKCSYCNEPAQFKLRSGKYCCEESWNNCPVNKDKNSNALKAAYLNKSRSKSGVAIDTYSEIRYKKVSFIDYYDIENPIPDIVLNEQFKKTVKNILIKERGYCCEVCKNTLWNNKPITLELEHVDGNNKNNYRNNLKLLCPNCHAQTLTWRRKKK